MSVKRVSNTSEDKSVDNVDKIKKIRDICLRKIGLLDQGRRRDKSSLL